LTDQKTHWKKLSSPDYLGAYAPVEPGTDLTLTIATVTSEMVAGPDNKRESCIVLKFRENVKPMILNATNAKTIAKLYKSAFIEDWAGRKIQIYATEVKAFGEMVDALRIRPFVPQPTATATTCADCSKPIQAALGVSAADIAKRTYTKYGKSLCAECAQIELDKIAAAAKGADPLAGGGAG
jgi:hypothetical protein